MSTVRLLEFTLLTYVASAALMSVGVACDPVDEAQVATRDPVLVQRATARWPGGIVPFAFDFQASDPALTDTDVLVLREKMAEIEEQVPGLRFVERDPLSDVSFIFFTRITDGEKCTSPVGRVRGAVNVQLTFDCISRGGAYHEIMHALGFQHEHARKDRDAYVDINWENIEGCPSDATGPQDCGCLGGECGCPAGQPCDESHAFATNSRRSDIFSYDFGSIMHYAPTTLSWTGNETITLKQVPPPGVQVGLADKPTDLDYAKLRVAYPVLEVSEFVFSDTGRQQVCRLKGREQDIATDFDLLVVNPGLVASDGNTLQTDGLGAVEIPVLCEAESVFFATAYDYPNTTETHPIKLFPRGAVERYADSTVLHTAPVAIVAALPL